LRDDIRKAAAIESSGAVAVVVQSSTTGRRATFRILPDRSIRVTTTDEDLAVLERPASATDPGETIEWLKGHR
jgi:DeoR/GlpR family transcriptional regulator of sugar metabolism